MRILMVTPFVPDAEAVNAGTLVMHWRLASMAARHEVTLATLAASGQERAIRAVQAMGIPVHVVPSHRPRGFSRWLRRLKLARRWLERQEPLPVLEFSEPRMQRLLLRLAASQRFDLLQIETAFMAPMSGYRLPAGIPPLLVEHEVALVPAGENRRRRRDPLRQAAAVLEWRRWQRYERTVWPRYQRIQAVTDQDASIIRRWTPEGDRVRVNPVGIELPEIGGMSEDPQSVVFVGCFSHQPNVDAAHWLAREIMPKLRSRSPGARLLMVGSDPPEAVRALAAPDLDITGRVPAVEPYLERAAVVLAPIRTGGGMRIKVLQALAHGKAVVTTPLGAEGLEVQGVETPLRIGADAESLAAATADLLRDAIARRELGRQARQFVAEHHTWSAHVRRLEGIYQELTGAEQPS